MFEQYPELLSAEMLAEALNIGRTAAYSLVRENKIKHLKNGRDYKIPRIAVEQYVLESSGMYNQL